MKKRRRQYNPELLWSIPDIPDARAYRGNQISCDERIGHRYWEIGAALTWFDFKMATAQVMKSATSKSFGPLRLYAGLNINLSYAKNAQIWPSQLGGDNLPASEELEATYLGKYIMYNIWHENAVSGNRWKWKKMNKKERCFTNTCRRT